MLWFKKQPDNAQEGRSAQEEIIPAELPLPLDPGLFQQHFQKLKEIAELDAGLEAYLESLNAKHRLFADVLTREAIATLDMEKVELLLEPVFSARRRLFPRLSEMGEEAVRAALGELLYGAGALATRMDMFVNAIQPDVDGSRDDVKSANKIRRAAHDFGAEMIHFTQPDRYPLMTRWVWDQSTVSGALREFIRGNDAMAEVPLGMSPEMFEGARVWFREQIEEMGLYRDVPFWIDLVQAQAYASYFRSMSEGLLSADFGRSGGPEEHLKKFLGIDGMRKSGQSRVKKVSGTGSGPALN